MTETDGSDARTSRELGAGALPQPHSMPPAGILIGYARCSTEKQDLTAQREILRGLGVADERVYLDHGLTGTNRSRPWAQQRPGGAAGGRHAGGAQARPTRPLGPGRASDRRFARRSRRSPVAGRQCL